MSTTMSANQLAVALRARYAPPAYAILFEVRNGTGWQRQARSADAIAMSLWPSRGLDLEGFELKVSRGDWLRELKDPAKAEEISTYCDRWWVVASDKSIVQPGELPTTWGLLVPRGTGLVAEKEAPKLEAKTVGRAFLAAILRRAQESFVPRGEIDAEIERVREKERARLDERVQYETRYLRQRLDELEKLVAEFEKNSGVELRRAWDVGNIASAVKWVRNGGVEGARADIERIRGQLQGLLTACDEQLGVHVEAGSAAAKEVGA